VGGWGNYDETRSFGWRGEVVMMKRGVLFGRGIMMKKGVFVLLVLVEGVEEL